MFLLQTLVVEISTANWICIKNICLNVIIFLAKIYALSFQESYALLCDYIFRNTEIQSSIYISCMLLCWKSESSLVMWNENRTNCLRTLWMRAFTEGLQIMHQTENWCYVGSLDLQQCVLDYFLCWTCWMYC